MTNLKNDMLPKLTETATIQIKNILKDEGVASFVKLSVDGGGCSGFSYKFSVEKMLSEKDIVISSLSKKPLFVIDDISLDFLKEAIIDWKVSLNGSSFDIKNPSAKSSCGCGTSFSI